MEVIVDRIEGEFLVVEIDENKFARMPKILVPNAKEGDIIKINIDHAKKKEILENVNNLVDDLFE